MTFRPSRSGRILLALLLLPVLLACGAGGMVFTETTPWEATTTDESPAWACPSPTPLPFGATGPVKRWEPGEPLPTTAPTSAVQYGPDEPVYWNLWEQEYPAADGPPFPSPTPYVLLGDSFLLGQRVRIPPLFAQVEADVLGAASVPEMGLYRIRIVWTNQTAQALPFDPLTQVALATMTTSDGREVQGMWRTSVQASDQAGMTVPSRGIPIGESRMDLAIMAPAGQVKRVDLLIMRGTPPGIVPTLESGAPTPTATPVTTPTPTPNTELRAVDPQILTVSFSAGRPAPQHPPCDDPGATTPWEIDGPGSANGMPKPGLQPPPGADRVVQLAMRQVGKPYVWGAAGPGRFDCSGLVFWVYGQVGLPLNGRRTAADQYAGWKPATTPLPGDAMYWRIGGSRVSHAGLYVGNVAGDPAIGDFVHASTPKIGVVLAVDGVGSFYARDFAGFRTQR